MNATKLSPQRNIEEAKRQLTLRGLACTGKAFVKFNGANGGLPLTLEVWSTAEGSMPPLSLYLTFNRESDEWDLMRSLDATDNATDDKEATWKAVDNLLIPSPESVR